MFGETPSFSRDGLGVGLGEVFERHLKRHPPLSLLAQRGQQLLIVGDIGGSQKRQPFETFSFLILDLDRNSDWLEGQAAFRSEVLVHRRRMAFKALNDGLRRKALVPFLRLAEALDGSLVTFAVQKSQRPVMGAGGAEQEELEGLWKPAVIDRLMWIIYLGAFLLSGFALAGQDVMFIMDEDEVAANVPQLTKLTELFARATSNQEIPIMGHLRCGTTKSDDGGLGLEDLAALPDLAAGATAEFVGALQLHGAGPLSPLIQRLPGELSWKTRVIMPWVLRPGASLARIVCLIDGVPGSKAWRATIPQWFLVEGPITSGRLVKVR